MKLTTRIAIRHLRSRHSFGFISFSTVFSILGLTFGIASLIIISCISTGFVDMVNYKLSGIDGHIRIQSYISDKISINKIEEINSSIKHISANVKAISPYIEKHALVRKGPFTEGIILYGVPESSLESIFNLNQFAAGVSTFIDDQSIIIGKKLAQILNAEVGDNIIIMDVNKMVKERILQANNLTIVSIFQTDFPEYDRLLAFMPFNTANVFFDMDNAASGLILNIDEPDNVEIVDLQISKVLALYPYMTYTWKERHGRLLEWLTLYDIPIKLIMLFIIIVSLFNIAASLWMIIINKTREFGILKSIGMGENDIKKIIITEGAIIGLAGALFGIIFSIILLYLQETYQFIGLSNDIYFTDYLPVKPVLAYFIIYPAIAFMVTLVFSYYPSMHASKITPADALRYE